MKLTRREALVMGTAAACLPGASLAASEPSLSHLARAKGLRFGSTVGGGRPGTLTGSFADPKYRALLTDECGLLVPENELKWGALRPDAATFDFSGADRLIGFAEEHKLAFRGHTLLWHHPRWFPAWVASHDYGANPKAEAERLIREHISTVCKRYGSRIHSWDVVNEAVDADTGAMRETPLSRYLTAEGAVDLAFHVARESAPEAQLVYNDYMSWEAGNETHRAGVLKLLEGFRKRGTPVDALGVQAHIGTANTDTSTGFDTRQEAEWRRFLDEVTSMGYALLITEFDVHDKGLPAPIPARDAEVAAYGKAYLDLMLSYKQLRDVLVWGMCDRYSWLQNLWLRPDGLPKRPTPYDAEFHAKPLREAIAAAFRAAPER